MWISLENKPDIISEYFMLFIVYAMSLVCAICYALRVLVFVWDSSGFVRLISVLRNKSLILIIL